MGFGLVGAKNIFPIGKSSNDIVRIGKQKWHPCCTNFSGGDYEKKNCGGVRTPVDGMVSQKSIIARTEAQSGGVTRSTYGFRNYIITMVTRES